MLPVRAGWKGCCEGSISLLSELGAGIPSGEEEAEFTFGGAGLKVLKKLRRGSTQGFLEMLREFAGNTEITIGINGVQGFEGF